MGLEGGPVVNSRTNTPVVQGAKQMRAEHQESCDVRSPGNRAGRAVRVQIHVFIQLFLFSLDLTPGCARRESKSAKCEGTWGGFVVLE